MPKTKNQCEQIREMTRQNIINKSILYFSRNGFSGTKISDLARYIGIAQGSLYNYFESKEALYQEIYTIINTQDLKPLQRLTQLPISAKKKIQILSRYVLKQLKTDTKFAAIMTLSTQQLLEADEGLSAMSTYQCEAYRLLAQIIEQGQKEGSVVKGEVMKLVDYYWGVIYLYALKQLFTTEFIMIEAYDLERVVLIKP